MLEIWIDGACEPINPGGTASYGLVVKRNSHYIFRKAGVVGSGKEMSNNVGEYSGLIAFLEWYLKNGNNEEATIHSDSQMLVYQMIGLWEARRGLYIPYRIQAWNLIEYHHLWNKFKFKWIPREGNWEADRLARDALAAQGITPAERG